MADGRWPMAEKRERWPKEEKLKLKIEKPTCKGWLFVYLFCRMVNIHLH
jgi:hypothetical protein